MKIGFDPKKEKANLKKHKLNFSFASYIFEDPLSITVYDRFEDGEERWHTMAYAANKLLLVIHTFPDFEDDQRVRVIGLREATPKERARYEKGDFDG